MKKELLIPSALALALVLAISSVAPSFANSGDEDNIGSQISAFAKLTASHDDDGDEDEDEDGDEEDNHGQKVSTFARLLAQSTDEDDDGDEVTTEDDDNDGKLRSFFSGWFKGKHKGEIKNGVGGSLEKRLGRIVARFDNNHDKHIMAYTKLQDRLVSFEARVEAAGYDTTDLEAHLAIFDDMLVFFQEDYEEYIEALRTAHEMSVNGSTKAEIDAQLEIAKDKLAVAKESGLAVREYYKTTLRADVLALKLQVEADEEITTN